MQNYDKNMPIAQIMYGQYIKYDALRNLVALEFASSNSNEVNIFIDVYEMLLPLYKSLNIKNSAEAISSTLINYAGHFREYFKTRHGTYANVIFVYSVANSPNITRFCPDYNAKYRNRINSNDIMAEQVNLALERMKQIVPYLPNVFLKFGTVEASVIIRDIIISQPMFQECPNIVISASQYAYQLPGHCPDTVVFRKKHLADQMITAYSYNFMNAINAYAHETRKVIIEEALYPKLISMLMALTGIPGRNIKSLVNIGTAINLIKLIPKECIGDIRAMYTCIKDAMNESNKNFLPFLEFNARYTAISIETQGELYRKLPESNEFGFMSQLEDGLAVRYCNDKYYSTYPIEITKL